MGFPLGSSYLVDQLKRALSSVLLNQAEGNGRRTPKERRRFFDIAVGSATETSAIFDIAHADGYIKDHDHAEVKGILEQVIRILYKLN
jgi:four helix bundle protein